MHDAETGEFVHFDHDHKLVCGKCQDIHSHAVLFPPLPTDPEERRAWKAIGHVCSACGAEWKAPFHKIRVAFRGCFGG
jgi:hypothetical protein